MCENNSIQFIVRVGVDEYSGFEAYFEAYKFLNLSMIPQQKMNVLGIDELIDFFHISRVDYDIKYKGYKVYTSRSIERYSLSGAEGRMAWVDKKIKLYEEHGWSIKKLDRYVKGLKEVESEIEWKNRNTAG